MGQHLTEMVGCCTQFLRPPRFLRIDPELADPEFVYWYLQNLYFNGVIENYQVQHTGIARFQFTKFADSIEIELPPIGDQKQIAAFFGSIDDRITLLRETNATLEAIAQALFKSWFVDFDPVRAKAEGRQPEGMDAATATLFPESFEESELGLVPRGWSVGYVADLAVQKKGTVNPLASPDEWFEHYSLPAFDGGQSPVLELGESIKSNKTRRLQKLSATRLLD